MAGIEQLLREAATQNCRIHLWTTASGDCQANVAEIGSNGWTCVTKPDAVDALSLALRQRFARVSDREIEVFDPFDGVTPRAAPSSATQLDIEDVLQGQPSASDDFEDLL